MSERTHKLFVLFGLTVLATFLCSIICYSERFVFLKYALSDLGGIRTINGEKNVLSFSIFVTGMFLCAVFMAFICRRYVCGLDGEVKNRRVKAVLCGLASIGFLIIMSPNDTMHSLHVAGGALMFFSLWLLTIIFLCDATRRKDWMTVIFGHLFLQSTVLTYALLYFLQSSYRQTAQKAAVFGLILVLGFVTKRLSLPLHAIHIRTAEGRAPASPHYRNIR
jgi:hypothetical membrane protein